MRGDNYNFVGISQAVTGICGVQLLTVHLKFPRAVSIFLGTEDAAVNETKPGSEALTLLGGWGVG